ncbi:L,D-transpeptidase [Shinella sp. G-2]|uniref:L,D-transpeptidase n=1 Tax=Shinella sp. G-2 TaxID=3133141 RepID=UPI003D018B99
MQVFRPIFRFGLAAALSLLFFTSPALSAQTARQFDARTGKWIVKSVDNGKLSGRLNAAPIAAQTVAYDGEFKRGTVIVDTQRRRLLYVNGDGTAREYIIGVGREGFAWKGKERVSRKAEWPVWTPPAEMVSREALKGRELPTSMEGGPDNPLGARAIYLGSTLYRIHGTNEPWTLGKAVSSGCIRMANDDVVDLFNKVDIGSLVIVR